MDIFIKELKSLESWNIEYTNILNNFTHRSQLCKAIVDRKITRIIDLCDTYLVNEKGGCNWDNIDILEQNGYYVGPGEQDRFGWLTGIISTKKGDIIFG